MKRETRWTAPVLIGLFCLLILSPGTGRSQAPQNAAIPVLRLAADAGELALTKGLAVGLIGLYGRSAVASDLLAWQIAQGTMAEPRTGVVVGKNAKGEDAAWAEVEAGKEGWIENRALSGGYLYMAVDSERPRTMILDATGFYVAWINGEPRGGEKYGADYLRHPVRLTKGRNVLLFRGERGRFKGRLYEPPADVYFTDKDMTLPDLVLGEKGPVWAGLRLVNATGERLERIEVIYRANGREDKAAIGTSVVPLVTQKLAVPLAIGAPIAEGTIKVEIRARASAGRRTVETPPFEVELRAVSPAAHHSRTFVSGIDGSVQYFGVVPMAKGETGEKAGTAPTKPALVLTLHGASVEGIGQARAYRPKDWCWIAAATNRRPYGFDWEDWGRLDALEVLAEAQRLFGTDPDRTYLTGHSMGGHGTWQVGATVPGPWAAIAPSAGWHSFSSYGGGAVFKDPTPVETMLARANNPSETMGLARNFLHYGIYVLHGDQDDNVPVTQARDMRELLGKFHPDFAYYERPGAGHWWGNECVDWPPLFQFLKERVRPSDAEVRRVEFVTANPGISAGSRWIGIQAQARPLEVSKVVIERDEAWRSIKGTTENVERLAIDILPTALRSEAGGAAGGEALAASGRKAGDAIAIELDGSKLEIPGMPETGRIHLERGDKGWTVAAGPAGPGRKGPHRA
ncbi:MAG: Prolyl oligopeptidase family protein, partial [Candidatus Aminicenantes bacterium]|nr:Prolyl oligopeptidase family protein [Candidatus Aminicenantes bacterium]